MNIVQKIVISIILAILLGSLVLIFSAVTAQRTLEKRSYGNVATSSLDSNILKRGENVQSDFDQTVSARVYFISASSTDCKANTYETVTVKKETQYPQLMMLLLAGPQKIDHISLIPKNTLLNSFEYKDGTASIVFSEDIQSLSGSCAVQGAYEQIYNTLSQFNEVKKLEIKDENGSLEIFEP